MGMLIAVVHDNFPRFAQVEIIPGCSKLPYFNSSGDSIVDNESAHIEVPVTTASHTGIRRQDSLVQICFDSTNITWKHVSVHTAACYIYRSTLKKLINHSRPWL